MPRPRKPASLFRYFHSLPDIIRIMVRLYVRYPLSLRNVEDLLFERGYDNLPLNGSPLVLGWTAPNGIAVDFR